MRRRRWEPGDFCHTCRSDGRDILGSSPAERLERLWRLRAALAAAGWDEAAANRRALATCGVVGVELLTAGEADRLIGWLAAAEAA